MNFEQILRQKMLEKNFAGSNETHSGSAASETAKSHFAQGADPAHLAFLIGQIRRTTPLASPGKYPYKPVIVERKPHAFNELQAQAFDFMVQVIPHFTNSFSARELKKAFRQAALIAHPDRGGSVEMFLKLKSHHAILLALVTPLAI